MKDYKSRLFILCSLLFFSFLPLSYCHGQIVSTGKQILSLRDELTKIAPKVEIEKERYYKKIDELQTRYSPRIDKLEQQIRDLLLEKEATKKELENGEYCSQCKRSKSKIERETKKPFHQHLTEVNGVSLPMTPLEIIVEMNKYDKQIERMRGQVTKLKKNWQKAKVLARDKAEDALLTLEMKHKVLKQKLTKLAKVFKQALVDYVGVKLPLDKKWLAGWNLKINRLAIGAKLKEKSINVRLMGLKSKMLLASQQSNQFDILDALKLKILSLQSELVKLKSVLSKNVDKAINEFENRKQLRINKRKVTEQEINNIISQVGIGKSIDTTGVLDVSMHVNTYQIGQEQAWAAGLNVDSLIGKYQNKYKLQYHIYKRLKSLQSMKSNMAKKLQNKYKNIFDRLDSFSTPNRSKVTTIANAVGKITQNWKRDLHQEWTKNTVQELVSADKPFGFQSVRKSLSYDAIKGLWAGTSLLYARRGVHQYMESVFKQKYPEPGEYYEKTFDLRLIDPDTGIASWFDFTLTKESEGVRGFVNKVFKPFNGLFDND